MGNILVFTTGFAKCNHGTIREIMLNNLIHGFTANPWQCGKYSCVHRIVFIQLCLAGLHQLLSVTNMKAFTLIQSKICRWRTELRAINTQFVTLPLFTISSMISWIQD